MTGTHVIVGGGLAGARAAAGLRESGFDGRVVLVAGEDELPYDRPELSKGYLRGDTPRERLLVHPEPWYAEHDVTLETGRRATALDPGARTVTLDDGRTLRWDKLLLATGSTPRRLEVPGADLAGVHYLRTVGDATALRGALAHGGRVVVVGGGWVGLEVAAVARGWGAQVAVIEPGPTTLHRVLGPETGEILAQLHRGNGVDVRTGVGVRALHGEGGQVRTVETTDGVRLPADAVVAAVGVRPETTLAEQAGLPVDDGIVVDDGLHAGGDVFAAGDVARVWSPVYGAALRSEHWAHALNSGWAAGLSMAGKGEPYAKIPYFYTDQYDFSMEYHGWVGPEGYDEVVYRGADDGEDDESQHEFIAFWLRGGRVQAAMNVNVWDQTDAIKALARGQARVDAAHLADTSVDLAVLAAAATSATSAPTSR